MPKQIPNDIVLEILVVDDEDGVRELLSEYVRSQGFAASTASDGRAAITALERDPGRYRIVLTDINMPGADGFEVLRAAKSADPSCYVIVITGFASIDSATKAVRLGAYDYLSKPFTVGQIDVVLRRIQDHVALDAENRRLTSRADAPDPHLEGRLVAIERRLARVESLLDRLCHLLHSPPAIT